MLVAENRQYDYLFQESIYQPKKKINSRTQPKRRTKSKQKVKYICFTIFGFFIALIVLFQYAKLNIINQEIISLEQEINSIYMLNDSVEGDLIASQDLNKIEQIAKDKLGMVEPEVDQMRTIEVQRTYNEETVSMVKNTQSTSAGFFGTL